MEARDRLSSITGTASSDHGPAADRLGGGRLSGDGNWCWNGHRWVPAITEDGLWRWDGNRWKASVELDATRPKELAATLARLAEESYAQAAMVLAGRPLEWRPTGTPRQLVENVQRLASRLRQLQQSSRSLAAGQGLVGRRGILPRGRRRAEEERKALKAEYRAALVSLGQSAPQPSVKEADDTLAQAHLLLERAEMLSDALAEVDQAERLRADAALAANKKLAASKEASLRVLQKARRALEAAGSAHSLAVAEARSRLRSVLTPGPGELKASLGPLRLHATVLETPTGRLPTAGLNAFADTAPALWRDHREPLSDVMLLEVCPVESFLMALSKRNNSLFLLIVGATDTVLWLCPTSQQKAAKRFVAVVNDHSRKAGSARNKREAKARRAEEALDAVTRDRSSVEAVKAALARAEAAPKRLARLDDERRRLEGADTPELIAARRRLLELAGRLVASPEPLKAAT